MIGKSSETPTAVHARAPGKLILSGEHAVVQGRPALVTAVNRFAHGTVSVAADKQFHFHLADLGIREALSPPELRQAGERLTERYEQFLAGERDIREVVQRPAELFQFALHLLLARFFLQPKQGLVLELESQIPIGCGMGSSAATIAGLLAAAGGWLGLGVDAERLTEYTWETEKLQHGRPSGADPYICAHGGCVRFRQGKAERILDPPAIPLYLVNTGTPESSTGECVMQVSREFAASAIWDEFEGITLEMENALQKKDEAEVRETIRKNQQLLVRLGVVPEKVRHFISELEKRGAAAKICGAGSIRGERAGMVLVAGEKIPKAWCRASGYEILEVRAETAGTRVMENND